MLSRIGEFRIDALFPRVQPAGEDDRLVERIRVGFPVQDGGLVDVSYQADSYCVDWISVYGEGAFQRLPPADQVLS